MGFNVTALAQKARTQTLIVDSDLDMGQYDLIATDVKGDTAEFSEFVGGVGNFESGLVSGGFDVSGILHAESNLQVDGGISLEGSINNVNITPEGEIITAQSITAAEFVGDVGNFSRVIGDLNGAIYLKPVTTTGIINNIATTNGIPEFTISGAYVGWKYYNTFTINVTNKYDTFKLDSNILINVPTYVRNTGNAAQATIMGFRIVQEGQTLCEYTNREGTSSQWLGATCENLKTGVPFDFYTYNSINTTFGRAYKMDSLTLNGI